MSASSNLPSEVDPDLVEYRSVSVAAIVGLILGLFAWLAWIGPLLWVLPVVGAAVSAWALRSIAASDGALIGRGAALSGLALSLMFGSAAAAAMWSEGWWLQREARPAAEHWFELLRDDQPHRAHQLTVAPRERQLPGADLWEFYRNAEDARSGLKMFVANPLVHALLAQGRDAEVRFYAAQGAAVYEGKQHVKLLYAVTYPQGDQRESFFASVVLERSILTDSGEARWRIASYDGGVNPFAWEKKP